MNHAGLAQTFPRAVRPPVEARTELQLAFDLLGRRGLVQAAAIRAELAMAIPEFAALKEKAIPPTGVRFELQRCDRVFGPTTTMGIVMVAIWPESLKIDRPVRQSWVRGVAICVTQPARSLNTLWTD